MKARTLPKFLMFLLTLFLNISVTAQCCSSKSLASNESGRCVGSAYCTACKNCSACRWCNSGGSCGVCGGGKSRSSNSFTVPRKSNRTNSNSETSSSPTNSFFTATKKTVTSKTLNVRSGPGTQYSVIDVLHEGDLVPAYGAIGEWTKVAYLRYGDSYSGYVFSKYLV